MADIAHAVQAIQAWSGAPRVNLLGWATGGHWRALMRPNTHRMWNDWCSITRFMAEPPTTRCWARDRRWTIPQNPGHFNAAKFGGWNLSTRDSLFVAWDNSIPVADKTQWRDETVKRAYGDAALASDNTSQRRTPHSFRAPTGAMADSFELAMGRKQWSATALTTVPVLVVRSERDFWSRPEDVDAIMKDAPSAEKLVIPEATHFVHLDRDNAADNAFSRALSDFWRSLSPTTALDLPADRQSPACLRCPATRGAARRRGYSCQLPRPAHHFFPPPAAQAAADHQQPFAVIMHFIRNAARIHTQHFDIGRTDAAQHAERQPRAVRPPAGLNRTASSSPVA
ncbi:alpha/beta fold hydrolase [Serratia marcescens]